MKNINKVIKHNDFKVEFIGDKPTRKGFPNKDSIVLNILYKEIDKDAINYAYTIKVPGDEFIPRIGKAITYKKYKQVKTVLDKGKNPLLSILKDMYTFEAFPKKYDERVINIISRYMSDIIAFETEEDA